MSIHMTEIGEYFSEGIFKPVQNLKLPIYICFTKYNYLHKNKQML